MSNRRARKMTWRAYRGHQYVIFLLPLAMTAWVIADTGRSEAVVTDAAMDGAAGVASDAAGDMPYHPSRLLVRFKPGASRRARQAARNAASAAHVLKTYPILRGLELVEVEAARLDAALAAFRANPNVRYAEPDYRIETAAVPDDPFFNLQWGLLNEGQTIHGAAGRAGADIRATAAWDLFTGDPDLRIAVIDTGVDYRHADLAGNIWTNSAEANGLTGLDDDGNGYIDDIHGYDTGDDDGDPMDAIGHGTHVAGIIGAVGDNGLGVSGVNWRCKLVPLKFFDNAGNGFTSDAVEAMQYVIENNIRLSNNSWGVDQAFSQTLYDVIEASQAVGHLFVAAAGNLFGRNIDVIPFYPASYDLPNIVAVTSTDNVDLLSFAANIGPTTVDLAAPGFDIYSTLPGNDYGYLFGTSMATAHVTGVAGLLMGRRPSLRWDEIKSRLLATARPLPSLADRTVTGGIVDALAAVGDCNGNGIFDEIDIAEGGSEDCNGNGLPDECEADCNGDDIPDDCDIATGAADDCNTNLIPDACDVDSGESGDCNGNAVPDECEIAAGTSPDLNDTGVPDECERCDVDADCDDGNFCTDETCNADLCFWMPVTGACDDGDPCTAGDECIDGACTGTPLPETQCAPIFSMRAAAVNGSAIPGGPVGVVDVSRGDRITIEMFAERWAPDTVQLYNLRMDPSSYVSGSTGHLAPLRNPTPDAGAFINTERSDYIFFGTTVFTGVLNAELSSYVYGGVVLFLSDCAIDGGTPVYLGTLILDVSETAAGSFSVCLDEDLRSGSFLNSCPDPLLIAPMNFECLTLNVPLSEADCAQGPDCNGNGRWDICDIHEGTSLDCNRNDVPDDCDIASGTSTDCNANAIPDQCDLADGTSGDCNANEIPDECEADDDCNGNGEQDLCDIATGVSLDCDGDLVPDECFVIHVDPNANGTGDGTSWSNAFRNLQDALAAAGSGCHATKPIWIAAGTYTPAAPGGDRAASFALVDDVALYGGFAGFEESLAQRDIDTNRTVLSGDLNGDDVTGFGNRADNSYHVVTATGVSGGPVLDGVTIRGGYADGIGADSDGAGLYSEAELLIVTDCVIMDNFAANDGGGVFTVGAPQFANAVIVGNHAEHDGGGMYILSGSARLTNCSLSGNTAGNNGGAIRHVNDISTALNCSFSRNEATRQGGGVFSGALSDALPAARAPSFITLANSILWGNVDSGGRRRDETAQLSLEVRDVRYSCVEGLTPLLGGLHNIGDDPLFLDDDGPDNILGTADDDLHLSDESPCVNAGNNDEDFLPTFDIDGDERIQQCRVDMGFDETVSFGDCNANSLPDACELSIDCNDNLIPDGCEPDCNANEIPDDCDIASTFSEDCTHNGIPDECEPDCNVNGVADSCDIGFGVSGDCDLNGIPDDCEIRDGVSVDCNANTVPDVCEVTEPFGTLVAPVMPLGTGQSLSRTVFGPPRAAGEVTVTFFARGDLADPDEFVDVFFNGFPLGTFFETDARDCPISFDIAHLTLTAESFNAIMAAGDGDIVATFEASSSVNPMLCGYVPSLTFALQYVAVDVDADCNANTIPDNCEQDSDGDTVIDVCDLCPADPNKAEPGQCGCGIPDDDSDADTVVDCLDQCPFLDDTVDDNNDGTPDCIDETIPTVSQWGLVVLALLLLTAGKVVFRRPTQAR